MSERKGAFLLGLVLFLAMFLIPFLALTGGAAAKRPSSPQPGSAARLPAANGKQFRILDAKTGQVLSVDDRTFLRGAVAAEMSPLAGQEALKAQAVACYTYYSRLRKSRGGKPDASLKGADFSAEPENWHTYVPEEQMRQRWGKNFDAWYKNLSAAADAVSGQVLTCDGELIDATYFAISSGNTEASENVWGSKRPYLVSVASPMDTFAGGFQTSVSYAPDEMKKRILKAAPHADLSGPESAWVGKIERTPAGTVKTVLLGGQSVTGNSARSAFGLRSANFTAAWANGKCTFTVKGYGHGVGMSQVGAQAMARQGADYRAILAWYYPTARLTAL